MNYCLVGLIVGRTSRLAEVSGHSRAFCYTQAKGDNGKDNDGHPAVHHHLQRFCQFVTDTLPDYVPHPDPLDQGSCSIALAYLDGFFDKVNRS